MNAGRYWGRFIRRRLQTSLQYGTVKRFVPILLFVSLLTFFVISHTIPSSKAASDVITERNLGSRKNEYEPGNINLVPVSNDIQIKLLKHDPINNITYYPVPANRPGIFPNADSRHLHGDIGKDSQGKPLWQPTRISLRMTKEEKAKAHEGYCFNTRVSASIQLDREVPDFNSERCKSFNWRAERTLPVADVIFVFHNEEFAALIRSVHSVLNRTPPDLLGEIILVNDASNATSHPWLFDALPKYVERLPKTRLVHLTSRRGLMMARIVGAKLGRSPVDVFLDSHIECAPGWIEPMLYEIGKDRKRMVTPKIHSISADSLEFLKDALGVISFSWTLGQTHPHWEDQDFEPMLSPVMAGGLFAADKSWFIDDLGGYDPEMRLYGGEEFEIGFKTWQCGGSLYNLPCSRVGHIFRTDEFWKGQVYKVPYYEIVRNKKRAAEVWMDEYKEIFDLVSSPLPENVSLGPLEAVMEVRERLQCKPFKWFLENVATDVWAPNLIGTHRGSLTNEASGNQCLDTLQKSVNEQMGFFKCHGMHGSQSFLLDPDDNLLRVGMGKFETCVGGGKKRGSRELRIQDCKDANINWLFRRISSLKNGKYGLMMAYQASKPDSQCLRIEPNYEPSFVECDENDPRQIWRWEK